MFDMNSYDLKKVINLAFGQTSSIVGYENLIDDNLSVCTQDTWEPDATAAYLFSQFTALLSDHIFLKTLPGPSA